MRVPYVWARAVGYVSARIADLEPATRQLCDAFIHQCHLLGIEVAICQTLRTRDEQELLYAKGRTRPGEPCHHRDGARPVGSCSVHPLGATVTQVHYGWHNAGRAFDFLFVNPGGGRSWEGSWEAAGAVGEVLGMVWGGRWRVPDRPHLENSKGLRLADFEHPAPGG